MAQELLDGAFPQMQKVLTTYLLHMRGMLSTVQGLANGKVLKELHPSRTLSTEKWNKRVLTYYMQRAHW